MDNKLEQPISPNQLGIVLPQFEVTDELLQRASSYVMNSKTNIESQRTKILERWDSNDKAYRVTLEDKADRSYNGLDDKAAPIIHDNIEAITSRLKEAILPVEDDLIEITSDNPQETELVKYRSNELNNQLEKLGIRENVDTICRMVSKFGTAIVKVPFKNAQKTTLTRQIVTTQVNTPIIDDNNEPILDANGQPMVHTEMKQEIKIVPEVSVDYFGPGYEVIDNLEDVYVDPLIERIEDQPIVIHRILATWPELMELAEKGVYFKDQLLKVKGKAIQNEWNTNNNRKIENSGLGDSTDTSGKPKIYEVYQAYCDFSIPNPDTTETIYPCVISVIGNTCIQLAPNPYFHQEKIFRVARYRKIEGEFYGMSAIDPVIDMYHEYNDTMNQINDAKVLSLNPIKIQKAGSMADKQDLDIEPGTTWFEKQSGDIRFAQFDFSPVSNGLQYLELLEQKINRGMGITPLIQGQGDETDLDKTWRGTNKLIQQADKKFKSIAIDVESAGIKGWAELAYAENCQFNPVTNQMGFAEIDGKVGFEVNGVENFFQRQEKIMNLQMFIQYAGSVPGINIPGLVNESADLLNIKIDPKYGPIYMPPPPPMPESKPLNVSVTIPLDPSKGTWQALAAADLLNKKEGLQLDLDAIGQAAEMITYNTPDKVKQESGVLPPRMDSYTKGDKRNA